MLKLSFSRAKPHVCETEAIAELVKSDIAVRGGGSVTTTREVATLMLDCGGVLLMGVKPFEVPETNVSFFPQHYSLIRQLISETTSRSDGAYYKLHVDRAYCLTSSTFEKLRAYLVEHEAMLLAQEASTIESLTERLGEFSQHPHIHIDQRCQ